MDRLSLYLTFMTGSVLVGGLVIAVLAAGLYGWTAIGAAVIVGMVLTWPAAYLVSRWIKREDPAWPTEDGTPDDPDADRPEI